MNTKHTPATWYLSILDTPCIISESDKSLIVSFADCSSKNIANAKLIAAAPELLEALESIKRMCDGNITNENNIWHTAHKAITKATTP